MTTKYIEEIIKDPRNKTYLSYQTFGSREGKKWFLDIQDIRYKKEVLRVRILDDEIEEYRCIIKAAESERIRRKEELRLLAINNNEIRMRAIEEGKEVNVDIKEIEDIGEGKEGEGGEGGEGF